MTKKSGNSSSATTMADDFDVEAMLEAPYRKETPPSQANGKGDSNRTGSDGEERRKR